MWTYNIKWLRTQKIKIRWTIFPFYNEEVESVKTKNKKNSNFKSFTKKPKELSNKQPSDILAFLPKSKKRSKRLKIN